MGLNPTEKFYNLAAKPDASAFQFVGRAKPATVKYRRLAEFGPIDMFDSFYENTKLGYERQIKELKKDIEKTKQDVKNVQKELRYKARAPISLGRRAL